MRFFTKKPTEGKPISMFGLAQGLRRLEEAWERLRINGGHVDWNGHLPTISIDQLPGEKYIPKPFDLRLILGEVLMYMPDNSITVNGKDFTAAQTGLTESTTADWYTVTSFTGGLNLYVKMAYADGDVGKPDSVEFGTSAPSWTGEKITLRIFDVIDGVFTPVQFGAITLNIVRGDAQYADTLYKSIAKPSTNAGFTDENNTIGLHGFQNGLAPDGTDLFCSTDIYSHKFGIREFESDCSVASMRWIDPACVAESVGNYLVDTCSWDCNGGGDFCLDTEFTDWYCGLEEGLFWEIGGDSTTNYGSSIGSTGSDTLIDLSTPALCGAWEYGSFCGGDLCSANISFSGTLNGHTIEFCSTDNLVYWS